MLNKIIIKVVIIVLDIFIGKKNYILMSKNK